MKNKLYSISRLNTYNNCNMSYKYCYIDNIKGNQNVYSVLGSLVHNCQEEYYGSDMDNKKDVLIKFLRGFNLSMGEYHFMNEDIRKKWYKNVEHFMFYHIKDDINVDIEQECFYTTPEGHELRGFIDIVEHNDDDTINILDWKTSSRFYGKKKAIAGHQLVLYALSLQQSGKTIKNLYWNMVKYCKADNKIVERRKLVGDEKVVKDCLIPYEFNETTIDELHKYINNTIKDINNDTTWKCNGEEFFCNNLCGYRDICKKYG